MPTDLSAFLAWLAQDSLQPETDWTGPLHLPVAQVGLPLLVLCDMPSDHASEEPSSPLDDSTARFIAAMMKALGLTIEDFGLATLAMRRPPGGLLEEATVSILARRMRRCLALLQPRAVLILGDRTSRVLLAADGRAASGHLREIHHDGGTISAIALPSADHLMRRPVAKAASWQTLRLLHGVLTA